MRRYNLKKSVIARVPIGYIRLMNDLGVPQRKRVEFLRRIFPRVRYAIRKNKK